MLREGPCCWRSASRHSGLQAAARPHCCTHSSPARHVQRRRCAYQQANLKRRIHASVGHGHASVRRNALKRKLAEEKQDALRKPHPKAGGHAPCHAGNARCSAAGSSPPCVPVPPGSLLTRIVALLQAEGLLPRQAAARQQAARLPHPRRPHLVVRQVAVREEQQRNLRGHGRTRWPPRPPGGEARTCLCSSAAGSCGLAAPAQKPCDCAQGRLPGPACLGHSLAYRHACALHWEALDTSTQREHQPQGAGVAV